MAAAAAAAIMTAAATAGPPTTSDVPAPAIGPADTDLAPVETRSAPAGAPATDAAPADISPLADAETPAATDVIPNVLSKSPVPINMLPHKNSRVTIKGSEVGGFVFLCSTIPGTGPVVTVAHDDLTWRHYAGEELLELQETTSAPEGVVVRGVLRMSSGEVEGYLRGPYRAQDPWELFSELKAGNAAQMAPENSRMTRQSRESEGGMVRMHMASRYTDVVSNQTITIDSPAIGLGTDNHGIVIPSGHILFLCFAIGKRSQQNDRFMVVGETTTEHGFAIGICNLSALGAEEAPDDVPRDVSIPSWTMDELLLLLPLPGSLSSKLVQAKNEYAAEAAEMVKAAASAASACGSSPASSTAVPDYHSQAWPKGGVGVRVNPLATAALPARLAFSSKTYQSKFDGALALATGVDASMEGMIKLLCSVARTIKEWDKVQPEDYLKEEGEEEQDEDEEGNGTGPEADGASSHSNTSKASRTAAARAAARAAATAAAMAATSVAAATAAAAAAAAANQETARQEAATHATASAALVNAAVAKAMAAAQAKAATEAEATNKARATAKAEAAAKAASDTMASKKRPANSNRRCGSRSSSRERSRERKGTRSHHGDRSRGRDRRSPSYEGGGCAARSPATRSAAATRSANARSANPRSATIWIAAARSATMKSATARSIAAASIATAAATTAVSATAATVVRAHTAIGITGAAAASRIAMMTPWLDG